MGFRAIIINKQSKLEFRQNYLIVRFTNDKKKIFINEISVLIIEITAVCITAVLLQELVNRNIAVIFCDNKRNPCSNLLPVYGSYDSSEKIKIQINWNMQIKTILWTEIVKEKVKKQSELLELLNIQTDNYFNNIINEIRINDVTNIEAQSAKKYFHFLFGSKYKRNSDTIINSALNYGYMVLLSLFNREVAKKGYLTQLGIHHDNIRNPFNLSCDLMEPFRTIVDREVYLMNIKDSFESEEKHKLLNIFNRKFIIKDKHYDLYDVIDIYCESIFLALKENDSSKIQFYTFAYGEK